MGGPHRAHVARCRTEHDGDQTLAVARGRSHQIVAGGADETGLETIGTRIAPDQLVEIVRHPAAEADRGDVHEIFVFRQIADHGAGEDRQIARRGDLAVGRQPVRVDVARLRHAEPLGSLIHLRRETVDRTADAFGEHHGHVVGRLHHHHLQRVVDGDLNARTETHLGRRLGGCDRRHRQQRVERQTPFLHRLQRDVGGHDLGHRGRIPGHGGVVGLQHLAGIGFDDQQRFGVHSARHHDGKRRHEEDQRRMAWQQAKKMHFSVPVL